MNSVRLSLSVDVLRADDDAVMIRLLLVQADEIAPIDGEHCSVQCNGEGKDVPVFDAPIRLPRLDHRQNIVAQAAQLINNLNREILVGIEPRHRSGCLLLTDRLLNLLQVGINVEPGIDEIGWAQRWEVGKDLGIGPA